MGVINDGKELKALGIDAIEGASVGLTSSVTRSLKACWLAQPPLRCSLTKKTPSQTLLRRLQLACVLTLPVLSLDFVSLLVTPADETEWMRS